MKKALAVVLLLVFVSTVFAQKLRIKDGTLSGCPKNVKGGIIIPEGVNHIDYHAFEGCTGLTSVTIPASVTFIHSAFYGCTALKEIIVSPQNEDYCSIDGVLYTRNKSTLVAYPNAHGSTFTIPEGVKSIDYDAFEGCTGLTSVTIPASVTFIKSDFNGCTALKEIIVSPQNEDYCSIDGVLYTRNKSTLVAYPNAHGSTFTIPEGVKDIYSDAFKGCTGLTSVTIPSTVKDIYSDAFKGCTSLTSITIPASVTHIRDGVFEGCTGLKSIDIPPSVTEIWGWAFKDCTGLESVTIPSSVKSIGGAFEGCTSLTSINIPSSVKSIGGSAFKGCTSLTSITFPNSVNHIDAFAFEGCTRLTSVTIPSSVTWIEHWAFFGCTGLKSARVPSGCSVHSGAFPEGCKIIRY